MINEISPEMQDRYKKAVKTTPVQTTIDAIKRFRGMERIHDRAHKIGLQQLRDRLDKQRNAEETK